jgi:hypothetical protein
MEREAIYQVRLSGNMPPRLELTPDTHGAMRPYPDDLYMANTWQGRFPIMGTGEDGYQFIAPVGCFPRE